jgi:hypothetical protein
VARSTAGPAVHPRPGPGALCCGTRDPRDRDEDRRGLSERRREREKDGFKCKLDLQIILQFSIIC